MCRVNGTETITIIKEEPTVENNSNNNGKVNAFGFLYRTRIVIKKGESVIVNLSVLFCIIALLFAPWLVAIGALVALLLGYRFSIDRNAAGFTSDFGRIFKDATDNVKNVVENVKNAQDTPDDREHNDQA
jgi:hypothetical protein